MLTILKKNNLNIHHKIVKIRYHKPNLCKLTQCSVFIFNKTIFRHRKNKEGPEAYNIHYFQSGFWDIEVLIIGNPNVVMTHSDYFRDR